MKARPQPAVGRLQAVLSGCQPLSEPAVSLKGVGELGGELPGGLGHLVGHRVSPARWVTKSIQNVTLRVGTDRDRGVECGLATTKISHARSGLVVGVARVHDGAMAPRLNGGAWPVRTLRLTIRPAVPTDAEATWRFRRLPSVSRWMSSCSSDREEYRRKFKDPDRLAKMLVIELDGVVIGDLMVAIEDAWAQAEVTDRARGVQAELGWCLSPEHEGHGYATEAVTELIRICFEDLGLRRVRAECFANNQASWRLAERVHMRREQHTLRDSLHRSGEWLDGLSYALLAEEWQARQDNQ